MKKTWKKTAALLLALLLAASPVYGAQEAASTYISENEEEASDEAEASDQDEESEGNKENKEEASDGAKGNEDEAYGGSEEDTEKEPEEAEAEYIFCEEGSRIILTFSESDELILEMEGIYGKNDFFLSDVILKAKGDEYLISKTTESPDFGNEAVFSEGEEPVLWIMDGESKEILAVARLKELKIDSTKPLLSVECSEPVYYDKEVGYYNNHVNVWLRVKEKNFDKEKILAEIAYGNEDFNKTEVEWKEEDDGHVAVLNLDRDGFYRVKVSGEDAAGNEMEVYMSGVMAIDTVAPVIAVEFLNESTAQVLINEKNFSSERLNIEVTGLDKYGEIMDMTESVRVTEEAAQGDMFICRLEFIEDGRFSFRISCYDPAGNYALYNSESFVLDRTAPKIIDVEYSKSVNEMGGIGYYNSALKIKARAEDNVSGVAAIIFKVFTEDGRVFVRRVSGDGLRYEANGIIYAETNIPDGEISPDGQFKGRVSVYGVDEKGNTSEIYSDERILVVDSISPVMDVSSNGPTSIYSGRAYFNKAIEISIEIKETNFNREDVILSVLYNGEKQKMQPVWKQSESGSHICSFTLGNDGKYLIGVDYTDRSGNTIEAFISDIMIVDTAIETPTVYVNGSRADGRTVKGSGDISLRFTDENPETCIVTLKKINKDGTGEELSGIFGEALNSGTGSIFYKAALPECLRENDGVYIMDIRCRDHAGNTAQRRVIFTIDRFGSVYRTGDYLSSILNGSMSPVRSVDEDIIITEQNPEVLTEKKIILEHNGKPVDKVKYYIEETNADDQEAWKQYRYVLSKENFAEDGVYRLTIMSRDRAGNNSRTDALEQELILRVDKTPPELNALTGLEQENIRAKSQKVKFTVFDAFAIKKAAVYIDGEPVLEENDLDLKDNYYTGEFFIKAGTKRQHIRLLIEDIAGNILDTDEEGFESSFIFYRDVLVSEDIRLKIAQNEGVQRIEKEKIEDDIGNDTDEKINESKTEYPALWVIPCVLIPVTILMLWIISRKKRKHTI